MKSQFATEKTLLSPENDQKNATFLLKTPFFALENVIFQLFPPIFHQKLISPKFFSSPQNGGMGVLQILGGLSQLMNGANNNGGGAGGRSSGGFDPSIIGNVIEMFTANSNDDEQPARREKRGQNTQNTQDSGMNIEAILNIASAFMGNSMNNDDQSNDKPNNNGLINLLPMAIQAINSFTGPEGEKVNARHKDHQSILPPFVERIHVMWDHFSNSELAQALWHQSGVDAIFKVCFLVLILNGAKRFA